MSLTIKTRLQSQEGFSLKDGYARVAVVDQYQGAVLQCQAEIFINEQAFLEGKAVVTVPNLQLQDFAPYDRAVEGGDILNIAHDRLIAVLAAQGVDATKNL